MKDLSQQTRQLKIYVGILTLLVLLLIALNIVQLLHVNTFKEINTERINIVDKDGTLRMAISNSKRQDPGTYGHGKKVANRERPAGMVFFNDDGDECGGLVYDGNKKSASMTYSIDQYQGDQIMQLQYSQATANDNNLVRSYGLKMWDRNDRFTTDRLMGYIDSLKELNDTNAYKAGINKMKADGMIGQQRLFVGKEENGELGLFLRDSSGIPRLKIYINKQNKPLIETLDEKGIVVTRKEK